MQSALRRVIGVAVTAACLLLMTAGSAYAVPNDVVDHWARPAIEDLVRQGVLVGYPDHTFKPDRFVSRGEFARMSVKAFNLPANHGKSFKDTSAHWAKADVAAIAGSGAVDGYPDGTFRPDQPITRAEVVAALNRLLNVGTKEQVFGQDWVQSYPDVPESHWAFRLIELARRLDYLPPSYGTSFSPGAVVTRAEAAWMIDRVEKLGRQRGSAIEVDPDTGTITVLPEEAGNPVAVQVDPDALVLRNNSAVPLEQILTNDELLALTGPDGLAKVVKASGKVNTNDLYSRLNGLTSGALTPETITAITRGDWTTAEEGLKNILFDRLTRMGLGPGEAQSLLDRDWVSLDLMSRDRLVAALSSRLGLSTDMSEAILSQDLARVKELLQTEITAAALGRLLQGQAS